MHPVLFRIELFGADIPIRFFGLFILDAFLFATLWVQWLHVCQKNREVAKDPILSRTAWFGILGIILGRILWVAIPGVGWGVRLGGILAVDLLLLVLVRVKLREALKGPGQEEKDFVFNLTFWLLVIGFLGARLFWIITTESGRTDFAQHPFHAIFAVWDGGIVYYGGLLTACAFGAWYLWKNDRNILEFGDILMIGVALTLFIGRWACFSAGCDHGLPTEQPWGLVYDPPAGSESLIPEFDPRDIDKLPFERRPIRGVAHIHPAQIYMSLNGLAIFLILSLVYRRKRFHGQLIWLFMILYAVGRSFIEIYRGDLGRGIYDQFGGLSSSQLISIPVFLIAAIVYLRGWIKSKPGDLDSSTGESAP